MFLLLFSYGIFFSQEEKFSAMEEVREGEIEEELNKFGSILLPHSTIQKTIK